MYVLIQAPSRTFPIILVILSSKVYLSRGTEYMLAAWTSPPYKSATIELRAGRLIPSH